MGTLLSKEGLKKPDVQPREEKRNTETMVTVFQYLGGTHAF